ncbi:MAG: hypothetical protein QXR45_04850 [Candidatus Bathyarchaeia archaeon]
MLKNNLNSSHILLTAINLIIFHHNIAIKVLIEDKGYFWHIKIAMLTLMARACRFMLKIISSALAFTRPRDRPNKLLYMTIQEESQSCRVDEVDKYVARTGVKSLHIESIIAILDFNDHM